MTCHLACALHVHDVASKPRHNAVGHPQRPRTSVARLDSCLLVIPAQAGIHATCPRVRPPRSRRRVQAASQRRRTSTAPSNICSPPGPIRHSCRPLPSFLRRQESTLDLRHLRNPRAPCALHVHDVASKPSVHSALEHLSRAWIPACGPFRHSCAGRNPRDLPSRARPPRSRRRVQAASQRRRTSTAPSNILSRAWIPACAGMTEVRERASGATTGQRRSGR